LQDPPKFTQIGIFGLKIYHLATLPDTLKVFDIRAIPLDQGEIRKKIFLQFEGRWTGAYLQGPTMPRDLKRSIKEYDQMSPGGMA
jgi:hypothetical protein